MHVGQPKVAAAEAVGEGFVIDAQYVEYGGPQIIDGGDVLHGVVTQVIGRAVSCVTFDAATG